MKTAHLLLTALMAAQTLAQSTDLLSVLASEAYSVFTSFTAEQPARTSAVSTAPTSVSSSASKTSVASSSETSVSSSIASSSTSHGSSSTAASSSGSGTSQTGSAAAASATNTAVSSSSSSSNSHNRMLAIILGTVLGALALGLLILVLLLLLRRRKQKRGILQNSYVSPSSDSTIEAQKTATSHVAPVGSRDTPTRPASLHSRYYAGIPLMSERSNHDMPHPHEFRDYDSMPFIPGTDNGRRSLSGPPAEHSGTWFNAADGLSSHPVHRNDLGGSEVATGLGGAAVGAGAATATARRSRHRRSHEEPTGLENTERHPQYLDGPYPSRSPRRTSMESAKRRSGSMVRTPVDASQDHTDDPTISAVRRSRDRERRRSRSSLSGLEHENAMPKAIHGPHEMSAVSTPPLSKGSVNPFDRNAAGQEHANFARAEETKGKIASGSSSRLRSYPPLPPALTIPQSNRVQPPRIPSRSPKRARFADKDTYHEPTPYIDTQSLKGSNISTHTRSSPWTPRSHKTSASTTTSHDLVSPISPEDTTRGFDHSVPIVPARTNLIHVPPSRDPSPNPPANPPSRTSDPFLDTSQHHSGLVDAVQTHFAPAQRSSNLYTLFPIESRNHRALTRKPVPGSSYTQPQPAPSNPPKPVNENWWRGSAARLTDRQHEDSAWASNYSNEQR